MNFTCQQQALEELKRLASKDRHSVLIEGAAGCGKTYLAKQYAAFLQIPDFNEVASKVNDIRDVMDYCAQLGAPVVVCIENLDKGVLGSSYTILKILEEPTPNLYIVVTCQNRNKVPDTIISRSTVVSVATPIDADLELFAKSVNFERYANVHLTPLWRCVRTFSDVRSLLSMKEENIQYILSLRELATFRDAVSNIVWKLGHFEDKTETPVELVIRYLMEVVNTAHVRLKGIECISDLTASRIAPHAVLSKFVFECKYCE